MPLFHFTNLTNKQNKAEIHNFFKNINKILCCWLEINISPTNAWQFCCPEFKLYSPFLNISTNLHNFLYIFITGIKIKQKTNVQAKQQLQIIYKSQLTTLSLWTNNKSQNIISISIQINYIK